MKFEDSMSNGTPDNGRNASITADGRTDKAKTIYLPINGGDKITSEINGLAFHLLAHQQQSARVSFYDRPLSAVRHACVR